MIIEKENVFKQEIELLTPQIYKNIGIIPLKTPINYIDVITLKKGMELGLVKVKECEQSQVNTLIVENNSTSLLMLVDGEQVIGGDQNRIINETILIGAKSEMKIPVSCTERGRWEYKKEFEKSKYMANVSTRRSKVRASLSDAPIQREVWNSIDCLEQDHSFKSRTSAMEESYENLKEDHNKIVKEFSVVDGQTGAIIFIDGEIKGFELFLNSEIYEDFHEKILKSYIIDSEIKDSNTTFDISKIEDIIKDISKSRFNEKKNIGLEDYYEFKNDLGFGSLYLYKDHIIHWSFFRELNINI